MKRLILLAVLLTVVAPPSFGEKSAELYLLLEGTERFQQNVLNLEADLLRLEQDAKNPAAGKLAIYFNTALASNLKVNSLVLRLDGNDIAEYQYTDKQRNAFSKGATQVAHVTNLTPGKHQLSAEFTILQQGKKHRGRRVVDFEILASETWLELVLEDVPGEVYESEAEDKASPPKRRIELNAQVWEAPK